MSSNETPSAPPAISIRGLNKTYDNGFVALRDVDLEIRPGEIFALLGPNGAGKTTLINAVCGIVKMTGGTIEVAGYDHVEEYREARSRVGLVPQELVTDTFESVWNTVTFSRELFGKPPDSDYVELLLDRLSLLDKRETELRKLSGGMKRRVMIAKALSHEPEILFLDEPTAGVDVELRQSMWNQVLELRETGVTIILTTHYLEEAEEMADRIGVIDEGKIILTEDKNTLMKDLGQKELVLDLKEPLETVPEAVSGFDLHFDGDGRQLVYTYDGKNGNNRVRAFMERVEDSRIEYKDLTTRQRTLEEIFVGLVNGS